MLLSKRDIARLENKGYVLKNFAVFDKSGYATLQNRDGFCVFYNVAKHQCEVYELRPEGCRVYPVILDEEKGIVVDGLCKSGKTVTSPEKIRKGAEVIKLLDRIDNEAKGETSLD
jgi:Fe-S-cluster containining protein